MSAEARVPIIAFIWRPEEAGPSVTQMVHRTGSRAIVDCSMMGAEGLHAFLQGGNPAGMVRDIKISASTLMDHSLEEILKNAGVQDVWVESPPRFLRGGFPHSCNVCGPCRRTTVAFPSWETWKSYPRF